MVQACADEQAPVRAALDGQLVLVGVLVVDEVFGGRDEVVEAILLVEQTSSIVPLFSVFSAATDVGDSIVTKVLDEKQLAVRKSGEMKATYIFFQFDILLVLTLASRKC